MSRWGFRHSVLEVTRRPVCHVLLQRCAGADMLDDAEAQAQLDEAAQLLTEAGFVQYLPRRWAKPGCEDKFWQGAANGMDVLAFGLSAYTRLDGMITTNTSDLNTYLPTAQTTNRSPCPRCRCRRQNEQRQPFPCGGAAFVFDSRILSG